MLALQGEIERLRDERAATPGGGAPRQRRAAQAHAHAEQLLRRARGAGAPASSPRSTTRAVRSRSGRHPTSPPISDSRCTTCPTCRRPPAASPTSRTAGSTSRAGSTSKGDPRTAVLQALSSRMLGHREPTSYAEFLRQRVETNYLTGALLIPEAHAVPFLQDAKADARDLDRGPARRLLGVVRDRGAPLHQPRDGASRHPGALPQGARVGHDHEGVRERRRELPDRPARRDRGADVLPAVDLARRLRRGRPLQPVLPVHRHRQRHLLVHGPRGAVQRGRALGQRRRALRRHEVVPRARHARTAACRSTRSRCAAAARPPTSKRRGATSPGRTCGRPARCSRRCRPAPSPASTRPTSTSSSRRTPRADLRRDTARDRRSREPRIVARRPRSARSPRRRSRARASPPTAALARGTSRRPERRARLGSLGGSGDGVQRGPELGAGRERRRGRCRARARRAPGGCARCGGARPARGPSPRASSRSRARPAPSRRARVPCSRIVRGQGRELGGRERRAPRPTAPTAPRRARRSAKSRDAPGSPVAGDPRLVERRGERVVRRRIRDSDPHVEALRELVDHRAVARRHARRRARRRRARRTASPRRSSTRSSSSSEIALGTRGRGIRHRDEHGRRRQRSPQIARRSAGRARDLR